MDFNNKKKRIQTFKKNLYSDRKSNPVVKKKSNTIFIWILTVEV